MLDGIFYNQYTPDDLIHALNRAQRFQYRIRVFNGKKGQAKPELVNVVGTLNLSPDPSPHLILRGKHGDVNLKTQSIVALKDSFGYLYKHPDFNTGQFRIAKTSEKHEEYQKQPHCILHNNTFVVAGKNIENLKRKIAFLKGGRMNT